MPTGQLSTVLQQLRRAMLRRGNDTLTDGQLLDEALDSLLDKACVPIVLCALEGTTRRQAAWQLGWSEGTLSGRLARAKQLLAPRLGRRGLALSAGALAVVLSRSAASAGVP